MQKYFMQVEAVNLAHVVLDSQDISTIRGGSFMLLDAVESMEQAFSDRLQLVTIAASQGLFSFESSAENVSEREKLEQAALEHLHTQTGGHATFLAAIEPDIPDNFSRVLQNLQAQIRRRQWRTSTVSIPPFGPTAQECYLDGWRPGVKNYVVDPNIEGAKISEATHYRRERGKRIKHNLFDKLLRTKGYSDSLSTKDLSQLAHDPKQGVLNGKIAFIHIDGNSFGRIRHDICTTPETRSNFDQQIQQACRNPFLETLLQHAQNDIDFQTEDADGNEALRIEVLLWGGDELTMVVPAWKGWEVIDLFFEKANTLQVEGVPLSHRATIVFCHHNAPILQIRSLAEDLLDRAKSDLLEGAEKIVSTREEFASLNDDARKTLVERLSNHEVGNGVHYLVLKSFDMLSGSLSSFFETYYRNVSSADLLLYASELASLWQDINTIRVNASRGKVQDVARALKDQDSNTIEDLAGQVVASSVPGNMPDVADAIQRLTATTPARWYMIADLLDFIPERSS
ncbi:MAG: hypothetical protein GY759_03505 [Chloroflexi bacterium]|nr:hypothetical protein [Chloroflexota bacterium]